MEPGRNVLDLTMRELLQDGALTAASRIAGDGREPAGAVILVFGADETAEVVGAVNRQLTIWKSERKPARYVDDKDRIVSVRAVRGLLRSQYFAFARDPDSGALDMLRGKDLPAGAETFEEAQAMLDACAPKRGWDAVPVPEMVLDALSLAMDSPPEIELIAEWSDVDRLQAARWALATHARASGNPSVKVPPVPNVLFHFARKRGAA